jgi:hypothetical protein
LAPGGRIIVVDFDRARVIPRPISGPRHRASAMETIEIFAAAGYCVSRAYDLLPYQWVLEFRREPCEAGRASDGRESAVPDGGAMRDCRATYLDDPFGVVTPGERLTYVSGGFRPELPTILGVSE